MKKYISSVVNVNLNIHLQNIIQITRHAIARTVVSIYQMGMMRESCRRWLEYDKPWVSDWKQP